MCDLVNSSLELTLASGEPLQLPICDVPLQADAVSNVSLGQLSLGIGVTTYNRRESLSYTLDKIQQHTRLPYTLVVADDGSSDGTGAMVSDRDINLIGGPNRGIAWNKNRCLFYLKEVKNCDVIILIEDDVYPNSDGWEMEWILASFAYGHVNSLPSWLKDSARGGSGKWHKPYLLHDKLSGQCAAFSAPTLSWVGYVDTRFKQFGHEHVEHTLRMVRAGFGGYPLEPEPRSSCFYAIDGDIRTSESVSHTSPDSVEANFKVFEAVWDESVYRPAWRGDHEYRLLRNEIAPAMPPPRSLRSNTVTKPKARHRAARKAIAWPFVNGF
jgi:glycosyltransferase involved in cell wall biosynthesis